MRRVMTVLLSLVACTSSQPSPANLSQAANFDQSAVTASNAVSQYRQAATTATTQVECTAALQQYVPAIQPSLDQMRSSAGQMDGYMKSAGNALAGDMECGVQVMAEELAHHEAVACMSPDMAVNGAEVQRHADAMLSFANHMEMRAVQVGEMMSRGGMMGPGQMMDAGWMMGWSDGGWMMPDGGMIDTGEGMPGCTYAGGGGYQAPDGGYWMDGGWVTGSPGSMMDGGSSGPMMDGGATKDGGMFNGALAGGAKRCEPPSSCAGPAMMAPNYLCPDQTVAGPACVAMADGTCAWRLLTCP